MTLRTRRVEIYAGRRGLKLRKQWYARVISKTTFGDEELFRSSEGYDNREDLLDIVDSLFPGMPVKYLDPYSAVSPR